jgi:peroxiredoxin
VLSFKVRKVNELQLAPLAILCVSQCTRHLRASYGLISCDPTMVECERCHKKFVSYAALSQHFETKHHNAQRPKKIERGLAYEKELKSYTATIHHVHGPSKVKIAVFLIILIMAIGVIGYVALTPREVSVSALGAGATAPDFTLPEVEGGTFTLSSYRGRANVLLFFNEGLACAPCLNQMTDLDQMNQQFTKLDIVAVGITGDSASPLASWAQYSGPQYSKVLSDQNLAVSRAYDMLGPNVSMMPGAAPGHSFVLVNKEGIIVWRHDYGPYNMNVPNDEIIAALNRALGE